MPGVSEFSLSTPINPHKTLPTLEALGQIQLPNSPINIFNPGGNGPATNTAGGQGNRNSMPLLIPEQVILTIEPLPHLDVTTMQMKKTHIL